MTFLVQRAAIIYLLCTIVSLIPVFFGAALLIFAATFIPNSAYSASAVLGKTGLLLSPILIFLMGLVVYFRTAVDHQKIADTLKIQILAAFLFSFASGYVVYLFALESIFRFITLLNRAS